jgi:flagellar hook assembly protein FlgD
MGPEGSRRLRLEVAARRPGDTLVIRGAFAQAANGGGASIEFAASCAASVDVTVLNVAGRVVRRLVQEREVAAGATALSWDGRDDTGTRLPGGRYLIRITAHTDEGQQASAITSLALGR